MKVMLPSHNARLTEAEFQQACELVDYWVREGHQIIDYSEAHGRDSRLYDRGNVWTGGFVNSIVNQVLSKKYNNINRLRLIGWHFSGYRVFDFGGAGDPPADPWFASFYRGEIEELPDNIDDRVQSLSPEARINLLVPRLLPILATIDGRYLHGQPMRFGEIAGELEGRMINGDSIRYWATTAVLERSGILAHIERKIEERGFCRVMEIGPGYGGLAYQLKKTFGAKLQFIAVDLVESLFFSSIYLTTLIREPYLLYRDEAPTKDHGLVFVPTFRSPEFFGRMVCEIDLCLNTVSMNEMSEAQVDYYGRQIARSLAPDGVFFECNWKAALAGADRIDVKSYLALHFNDRLSIAGSEAAGDGNLDLWAKTLPATVLEGSRRAYGADEPEAVTLYTRGGH